jgi:hypothetical protein
MASFRGTFSEELRGLVEEVVVGAGPCGELRYPSYVEANGWRFPGGGTAPASSVCCQLSVACQYAQAWASSAWYPSMLHTAHSTQQHPPLPTPPHPLHITPPHLSCPQVSASSSATTAAPWPRWPRQHARQDTRSGATQARTTAATTTARPM